MAFNVLANVDLMIGNGAAVAAAMPCALIKKTATAKTTKTTA